MVFFPRSIAAADPRIPGHAPGWPSPGTAAPLTILSASVSRQAFWATSYSQTIPTISCHRDGGAGGGGGVAYASLPICRPGVMGTWRLMTGSNRTRCFGPSSSLSSTSITVGVSGRTGNLAGLLFVALAGGRATACTGGCAVGYAGGCGCGAGGWPHLIWPDDPHRDGGGGGGAYVSLAICRPGVMGTWRLGYLASDDQVEPYLAGGWATACLGGCAAGSGCAVGYGGGCGAGCWARGCTGGCGAGGCCAGGGTDNWAVGGPASSFSAAGLRNTTPVDPGHDVGGGVRPASTAWSKIGYVASSRTSVNGRVTKGSAASSSGGGFLLLRRGWKGNRAGARLTLLLLG
ncbi:hypothetical protein ACLKA6_018698 [Drosophila palustris]